MAENRRLGILRVNEATALRHRCSRPWIRRARDGSRLLLIKLVSVQGSTAGDAARPETAADQLSPAYSRSPTNKPHPDSCGGELYDGKMVCVVLFEAGCDGSEVLDLVKEAIDQIAVAIQEGAESQCLHPPGHGLDIGPGALADHRLAQRVAVVGAVGEKNLVWADAAQHAGGASAVMCLAFRQLEPDRQSIGIDESVDLGGQSAARAPHASGNIYTPRAGIRCGRPPFLTSRHADGRGSRAVDHLQVSATEVG
jgi:hypothetical protein